MRDGTALIDAHGLGLQPECADQVRDARPARIFDGHPVARPQLCLQDAFDAIERAAGDGDVPSMPSAAKSAWASSTSRPSLTGPP